jgi:hypothetical protein
MSLRLLKVTVQPVFVQDDGETLTERPAQPIVVAAADWPDFPAELERRRIELESQEPTP